MTILRKHILAIPAVLSALTLVCLADEPALRRYSFTEQHMGTRFEIILYAPSETAARDAARAAFARIAQLDGIMSDYRPTSELMQLSKKAGGPPVPVSADLFDVLYRSQEISRLSGGAFDVTVGPVVRLWRRARRTRRLPDPAELARARAVVGYDKIRLDAKERTVQLTVSGMLLDLGAIAKGYAVEAALEVLRRYGITRVLIAASGDIVAGDPPPGARGWKVAIAPLEKGGEPSRYILLNHAAVSTAGDTEQFVEIDGKRYSHIVDPHTGIGLTRRSSATVMARDGTTSDGLDTAVSVLGAKRGMELVDGIDGAALLYMERKENEVEVVVSKRCKEYEYVGK
jgi:thiamine biosynthesis lipoprotein